MANEKLHIPFSKLHHHDVRAMQERGVSTGKFVTKQEVLMKLNTISVIGRNHLLEEDWRRQLNICLWKLNLNLLKLLACSWSSHRGGSSSAQNKGWASQVGRETCNSFTGSCWTLSFENGTHCADSCYQKHWITSYWSNFKRLCRLLHVCYMQHKYTAHRVWEFCQILYFPAKNSDPAVAEWKWINKLLKKIINVCAAASLPIQVPWVWQTGSWSLALWSRKPMYNKQWSCAYAQRYCKHTGTFHW